MKTAETPERYYEYWQNFLGRLEKVWRMAERECESVRESFRQCQQSFTQLRKTDPLLAYLKHARDVDQHTIQPVATYGPGFQVKIPAGATIEIDLSKLKTGKITFRGPALDPKVLDAAYMVLPIVDRGKRYCPDHHLGKRLETFDPAAIAEMGLQFYERFVGFSPGSATDSSPNAPWAHPGSCCGCR